VGSRKAIFRDGAWVSCARPLEVQLNAVMAAWIEETGGPSLKDGDPERSCARAVAERVGGQVLRHIPSRGHRMHDMFLSRRQMTLSF